MGGGCFLECGAGVGYVGYMIILRGDEGDFLRYTMTLRVTFFDIICILYLA